MKNPILFKQFVEAPGDRTTDEVNAVADDLQADESLRRWMLQRHSAAVFAKANSGQRATAAMRPDFLADLVETAIKLALAPVAQAIQKLAEEIATIKADQQKVDDRLVTVERQPYLVSSKRGA